MAKSNSNPEKVTNRKREDAAKRNSTGMYYPSDLFGESNGKAIVFHIYEYQKPTPVTKELKNLKATFSLPMPSDLAQNNGIQYNSFDGGFMERSLNITGTDPAATAKNAYNSAINAFNDPIGAIKKMASAGTNAMQGPLVTSGGIGTLLSLGGNAFGSFASRILGDEFSVLTSYSGKTLNPYTQAVFQSVSLREYQFQYMFIAKTQKESETIYQIAETIKESMHPTMENSYQIGFPDIFHFTFLPKSVNKWLFHPMPCALSGFNVSYNGQNGPRFVKDTHAPVVVSMQLTLQELVYETRDSLRENKENKDKQQAKEDSA